MSDQTVTEEELTAIGERRYFLRTGLIHEESINEADRIVARLTATIRAERAQLAALRRCAGAYLDAEDDWRWTDNGPGTAERVIRVRKELRALVATQEAGDE